MTIYEEAAIARAWKKLEELADAPGGIGYYGAQSANRVPPDVALCITLLDVNRRLKALEKPPPQRITISLDFRDFDPDNVARLLAAELLKVPR